MSVSWFGVRKALTEQQKQRAAVAFDAQTNCLSAGKRLLDTKHPTYKALTAIRGRVFVGKDRMAVYALNHAYLGRDIQDLENAI